VLVQCARQLAQHGGRNQHIRIAANEVVVIAQAVLGLEVTEGLVVIGAKAQRFAGVSHISDSMALTKLLELWLAKVIDNTQVQILDP